MHAVKTEQSGNAQIDINQDKIYHATSKSFHGSSVQTKDVMSEKQMKTSLKVNSVLEREPNLPFFDFNTLKSNLF